jgi:hypothetical protein
MSFCREDCCEGLEIGSLGDVMMSRINLHGTFTGLIYAVDGCWFRPWTFEAAQQECTKLAALLPPIPGPASTSPAGEPERPSRSVRVQLANGPLSEYLQWVGRGVAAHTVRRLRIG